MNHNQVRESAPLPERAPAVNDRVSSLEGEIESLHKELQQLTNRLLPYTMPIPDDNVKAIANPPVPMRSPFCDKLAGLEGMVGSAVRQLRKLNEMLEI